MQPFFPYITGLVGAIVGFIVSYIFTRPNAKKIEKQALLNADRIRKSAEKEGNQTLQDYKKKADRIRKEVQKEEQQVQARLDKRQEEVEARLEKREQVLEQKIEKMEASRLKYDESALKTKEREQELKEKIAAQNTVLADISALTPEQAREKILNRMEAEMAPKLALTMQKKVELMREEADREASNILVQSIQRFASPVTTESTTSVVKLKSDEIKGKIIGREGRNINAFEMITGVDVIIDDAPGTITLSSYDMFRRYVAKMAMEELLKDGRIQPASIEKAVAKAESNAEQMLLDLGKEAADDLGVDGFPREVLLLVGRLRFRTSYGQNVLNHSKEVAWLAEAIAEQVPGADPLVCKKAGLVHDIGKAVSHEVEGGHAIIGKEILEKFGVAKPIVQAMMSHHEDLPYETIEARILQAADAISASRPGARRETLEKYIKRLKALENIANDFKGVRKAYAIQAGREVRVFVNADQLDDLTTQKLSFDMARQIEQKCDYPGEVKVTVIREKRYIEKAR